MIDTSLCNEPIFQLQPISAKPVSMSASPPITISDGEIYALVDINCSTGQLEAAAEYAKHKIAFYRRLYPGEHRYDNDYLIALTRDCLRELAASEYTERRFKDGRTKGADALS